MRIKENHHAGEEEKTSERSVKVLLFGMFSKKKKEERSSPPHEDSRDKRKKSTHDMSVSEKLKHSSEKEKAQHENRRKKGTRITTTKNHLFLKRMTSISQKKVVVKEEHSLSSGDSDDQRETTAFDEKGIMRISTTKNHFFLERMTSISHKRSQHHHHHVIKDKHNLSDQSFARSEEDDAQIRNIVSLLPVPGSLFRSPRRICHQNPTLLTRSASDNLTISETLAANSKEIEESAASLSQDSSPSVSKNFVTFEISQLEAYYYVEKEKKMGSHEESLPQPSLLSAGEYELVLEPLFIQYEINPSRGEAKGQTLCNQFEKVDEKETVFKYVKAVLDAINSSWEEMYLKTEFSDQILKPALFSNIPFSPSQLCAANHNHKLIFDSINELIFEFCRFPQWVSFVKPRTQVLSFSDESIVDEVQKEVYSRLFPLQFADSAGQIIREDMDKRRNWWLDVRCEVECIGFETSELILNELLDQLIFDFCR